MKYGVKTGMSRETEVWGAQIFLEKCKLVAEEVKGPVLVCGDRSLGGQ